MILSYKIKDGYLEISIYFDNGTEYGIEDSIQIPLKDLKGRG
jgi:hypothetical protein